LFRRLIKFLILKIDQVLNKLWVQSKIQAPNSPSGNRSRAWHSNTLAQRADDIENIIYENEESSPFTPEWIIALNMSFEETDKNAISGREPLKYNPENGF
jgi:hypothetical protein